MSKRHSLNISVSDIKGEANVIKNEVNNYDLYRFDTKYDVEVPSNLLNNQCLVKEVNDLDDPNPRSLRIALYSPDTMGLGHMRRCLKIAKALVDSPLKPVVLMIYGAREANFFSIPPGVDFLTLPAIHKSLNGHYQTRSLDISLRELISLRSKTIRAAIEAFKPDVFIVDKVPRGALMELDSTLQYLRNVDSALCILGLRDVLDDPKVVHREWHSAANEDAIRKYYDAVWVYGDPLVYNPVLEYQFPPEVAAKVCYTGYLNHNMGIKDTNFYCAEPNSNMLLPKGRLVLCLVGGGQDGAHLAETFANAHFPEGVNGVIIMGPFMVPEAQKRLRKYAEMHQRLNVFDFLPETSLLLRRSNFVIGMGGYNTICEILSHDKPALIVPRVKPRSEQLIRAQRLQNLGLVDMLHPEQIKPQALTKWLMYKIENPSVPRDIINLSGLEKIPRLLGDMLSKSSHYPKLARDKVEL
jgi:predicted glycosyltransferase